MRFSTHAIGQLVRSTTSFLLPPVCVVCERLLPTSTEVLACDVCWSRLTLLPHPQCARCGHPGTETKCHWCAILPSYVNCARSVCWMPDATAGPIVHAFKYDGWYRLSIEIAARMARLSWPAHVGKERAGVVGVPLSGTRLRERGYNQSALLAAALGQAWAIPVFDAILSRTRHTRAQARLTPEQRLHNVANAFRVASLPDQLVGAHLVLVDDVITTSATLNACAAALFEAGVRAISYVTFGRARSLADVHT